MIESALAFDTQTAPASNKAAFQEWKGALTYNAKRLQPATHMRYDSNARTAGPLPVFNSFLGKDVALHMAQSDAPTTESMATPQDSAEEDAFTFGDVIDIINPLHHIPVVGPVYRHLSGDTIKSFASIIGGGIFGGPVGAIAGTAGAILKDRTGKDTAENLVSMVSGEEAFRAKPPALTYGVNRNEADMTQEKLATANASRAVNGRYNFAALSAPAYRWNV